MDSELRNAYELSRIEHVSDGDDGLIEFLTAQGRVCVYEEVPFFCKFTDAYLTSERYLVAVFFNFAAAQDFQDSVGGDYDPDYGLGIRRADYDHPNYNLSDSDDDCPF